MSLPRKMMQITVKKRSAAIIRLHAIQSSRFLEEMENTQSLFGIIHALMALTGMPEAAALPFTSLRISHGMIM